MTTRSAKMKTKKNLQGGRARGSSTSTGLDENLWGTLSHHIDLAENVYSKLPLEEFFHLRTVCKDWYVIACKRLALKEPIHKPFFSLFTKGLGSRLDGILTYNALSRSWDWTPGPAYNFHFDFVTSQGVVFSCHELGTANSASVFYWHSNTHEELNPPPFRSNTYDKMILGMSVSEKEGPSCLLRVVRGSQDVDTQVYDSGLWETKPCRVPKLETGGPLRASTGCTDCNGRIYITTEHTREIFVYDFEKASWSSLRSPCDWVSELQPQYYRLDTLGTWNGCIFDVTCDFQLGRRKKNWSLQVWELVDETLHKWKVYDCMPKDLCSWLRSTRGFLSPRTKAEDISLQASFCGDFVLVYSWNFTNGSAGRFCLFNMATKNWQKLNIAAGTVTMMADLYDESESSDDSSDLEAYAHASMFNLLFTPMLMKQLWNS